MDMTKDYSSQKTLTLVLYILYITAIFSGGVLAIVALIVNYLKRQDMQGSIFASHFTWQIQTFWYYLALNVLAFLPFLFLFFTTDNAAVFAGTAVSATFICIAVAAAAWIWIVYQAIKGLLALNDDLPVN